ncbi:hypothetical protein PENTCL1PPCAC_20797, partial [Pristionchus entomophagus]
QMTSLEQQHARALANMAQFPTTEIPKLLNDFTIGEQIGRGHFHISVVHRASYNGTEVAVRMGKLYNDSYENAKKLNELFNQATLVKHHNVVKIFGYSLHEQDINGSKYINHASVLELMVISMEQIWKVAATRLFEQEKLEFFLISCVLQNVRNVYFEN